MVKTEIPEHLEILNWQGWVDPKLMSAQVILKLVAEASF